MVRKMYHHSTPRMNYEETLENRLNLSWDHLCQNQNLSLIQHLVRFHRPMKTKDVLACWFDFYLLAVMNLFSGFYNFVERRNLVHGNGMSYDVVLRIEHSVAEA